MSETKQDQREAKRSRVLLKGKLRLRGGEFDCVIANASASGVRIRAATSLHEGEVVGLVIDEHPEFPAVVVWQNGVDAGLGFIDGPSGGLRRWGERAQALGLL